MPSTYSYSTHGIIYAFTLIGIEDMVLCVLLLEGCWFLVYSSYLSVYVLLAQDWISNRSGSGDVVASCHA